MGSSDSEDSEHSHITVVVTPEDLYAACTTACTPERCDNAMVRPLEPPLVERGQPGQFIPFEVTTRDLVIRDLPATPIDLLFRCIPQEMAESWAQRTNEAPRSREGPRQRHSRENQWRPASAEEIYLFLCILIYMGIHHETNMKRYWSNSFDQEDPIYFFTRHMPRDCFLLLFRRLRIFSPAGLDRPAALSGSYGRHHRRTQPQEDMMPSVYRQVDRWSKHIQETRLYVRARQ